MRKILGIIFLSFVTTVLTMIAFLFVTDIGLGTEPEVLNMVTDTPTFIREVIHHEEAAVTAIDEVAEAIVGVVTHAGGTGFFGIPRSGSGSGVVYAVRDGNTYVVTNEHVIDGSQRIEVAFNDDEGTMLEAELVGADVYTDIAVLRIENFEAEVVANFGRTEDLQIGQTVIAIGNPLGLDFAGSATMGIVSGHDRSVPIQILSATTGQMQYWEMTVLQTDAALNPGNSGGALINLAGEVIGINSMRISQAAVEGMSFSIPTYIALPIIEDLETYGEVTRPFLGVTLGNVTWLRDDVRAQLELPDDLTEGVVIDQVMEDSLAEYLGLESGDVITAIGNQTITDMLTFRQTLFTSRHGDEIVLDVFRDGEWTSVSGKVVIDTNR